MQIKCPCCSRSVGPRNLKGVESLIPYQGFMAGMGKSILESFMYAASMMPEYISWACDRCIGEGKAIPGNPRNQYYDFGSPIDIGIPFLAYYDKERTCEACAMSFRFSKEEQRYWYEELGFIVYARATHCPPCRRERRRARNLNTELSDLLRDDISGEKDMLLRVAEIYREMNKPERMRRYENAASKL